MQAGGAANGSQPGAASTAPAADETATAGDRAGADAASGALSDAVTKSGAAATIVLPPSGAAGSPDSVGGKDAAGNGVLAGNAVRAADAVTPPAAGSDSVGPGAAAAATVAARALASAATSPAAEGSQPPAFANALNADGAGEPQINLALAEGSDATGATASALQAANAAASTPPAPPQALVMPSMIAQTIGDGSVGSPASPAASPVSAALMSASDSTGLAGDNASHAHEGMGDGGAGLGANGGDGAAALQQLSAASASSSTDSPPPTLRVHAPVDSTDFPQGVADRVSFAVDNNWGSAKLQVTPPQLGPIDLQIAVQGDHAQVMMSTHSAVTREALESSLPKLREMLGSQGFTQVSVDISQRSFQDRSAFNQPYTWTKGGASSNSAAAAAAPVSAPSSAAARATVGVLDAYA